MEVVTCYCLKCKSKLGQFYNSWNGIGSTYLSPVYSPLPGCRFDVTGDIFQPDQASSIQRSVLQDIACDNCQTVVGVRCDSAPHGHVLERDQLMLKIKNISLVYEGSGTRAKVLVSKVIPLRNDTGDKVQAPLRASTAQPSTHPQAPSFRAKNPRPPIGFDRILERPDVSWNSSTSFRPTVHPDSTVDFSVASTIAAQSGVYQFTEEQKFKAWAEKAIQNLQKDSVQLSGTVQRVEEDMKICKELMQDIRNDLLLNRQNSDQKSDEHISNIRNEFKKVEERLDRAEKKSEWSKTAGLLARNITTLAEDVTKIKTTEVLGLKSTVDDLVARVKCVEEQTKEMPSEISDAPLKQSLALASTLKRTRKQMELSQNIVEDVQSSPEHLKKLRRPRGSPNVHAINKAANDESSWQKDVVDLVSSDSEHLSTLRQSNNTKEIKSLREFNIAVHDVTPQVVIATRGFKTQLQNTTKASGPLHTIARKGARSDPKASRETSAIYVGKDRRRSDMALNTSTRHPP